MDDPQQQAAPALRVGPRLTGYAAERKRGPPLSIAGRRSATENSVPGLEKRGADRPFAAHKIGFFERAGSAKKRSFACAGNGIGRAARKAKSTILLSFRHSNQRSIEIVHAKAKPR